MGKIKYEDKILEIIGKNGPSLPYQICSEIAKEKEEKRILDFYTGVLKAIKRLGKNEFLVSIPGKDSKGRRAKFYGLAFKGLLRLSPKENVSEIIQKNWKTLTDKKLLTWYCKFYSSKGLEKKKVIYDSHILLLLGCLKYHPNLIEKWKKEINLELPNHQVVLGCYYQLVKYLPHLSVETIEKIKKENGKAIFESFKTTISLCSTELMQCYDNIKLAYIIPLQDLIQKLNLPEKEKWFEATEEFVKYIPAETYIPTKNYGYIPKFFFGVKKQSKKK